MEASFIKWAEDTYGDYEHTVGDLVSLGYKFIKMGCFDEYVSYLKEGFNNAFAENDDLIKAVNARVIAKKLSNQAKAVLVQLVESPLWCGDIASKVGRDELFEHGLVVSVANENRFGGNTAANHLGFEVWKALHKAGKQKQQSRRLGNG